MKYIKNSIIFFLFTLSLSSVAQEATVYNTTAGNLSSVIGTDDIETLREIKLTGSVNAADFFFMRDNLRDLKTIDMSEVKIEACEIEGISYAVNEIPAYAFYVPYASAGMSRLNTFYFPLSTESIGENALYQSVVLRTTNLGELSSLKTIKSAAISRCTRLREIELPASVVEIEAAAFAHNPQLNIVVIPEGSQLSILGCNVFNGCNMISSLDFSTTRLTEVGEQAFNACSQLSDVKLPSSVEYIGDEAFMYTAINNIDWSHLHKLQSIEGSLFYGIGSLKSVILPLGVEEIKASAFALCSGLSTISLPYNLTAIGDWAFANCTSLRSISCPTPVVPQLGYQAFQGVETTSIEATVLESIISLYQSDAVWSTFTLIGNPFTGINTAERSALQLYRSGRNITVVSQVVIATVTLYGYNGGMIWQEVINDTQATIELPTGQGAILHLTYTDGHSEVVKL